MITIYCVNTGTRQKFPEGTTLQDMVEAFDFERPHPIIAAKVNNVSQGLRYRAFNNRNVEFLDYTSYTGRGVYRRSLCFLLYKAAHDIFPGCRVVIRRPISKGFFCYIDKDGKGSTAISKVELMQLRSRMEELVEQDIPFRRHEVQKEEAIEIFRSIGADDKVRLLETTGDLYVIYYTLLETPDYYYDALLTNTGHLKIWSLTHFRNGLLLRVPDRHRPEELTPLIEQPKTF
jgi:uridine kinase